VGGGMTDVEFNHLVDDVARTASRRADYLGTPAQIDSTQG